MDYVGEHFKYWYIYIGKYNHLFLIYSEKQTISQTIIKVEDCIFSISKRNDRDKEKIRK